MKKLIILISFSTMILTSCKHQKAAFDEKDFTDLMQQLAHAWTTQNTDLALSCFTVDAIYIQPPDEQFYEGHEHLRPLFAAIKEGTSMHFHHLWFDENEQTGVGEFTFGNPGKTTGVTGVAVVSIEHGKIKTWREYFIQGPIDFKEFISTEGKNWKWHIGQYQ